MRRASILSTLVSLILVVASKTFAQSWNTTGNSSTTPGTNFIGTTDAKDFVFKTNNLERGRIITAGGIWRFGTANDFVKIDSSGKLTLGGNGVFRIANNKYVFQNLSNNKIGLFYNSNIPQYEFRDGNAVPVFSINAASGNLQSQILSGTGYRAVFADAAGNLTTSIPALAASEVTNATAQLIPDNNCAGAASTITFSGLPVSVPSASVTVTLNVTHPALNDLTIYLVAPDGSIINLISGNLGGGNLVNTVFNDGGNSLISGSSSYTGTFKANGSLIPYTCSITGTVATFGAIGGGVLNPNGSWVLKLYDITAGNSGILNNWTISVNPGTSMEGVWGLNGNSGNTSTNFIGTTDKQSLRFKVNNINAGLIGIQGNVALGVGTLNRNIFTTGLVAIGDSALYNNGTNSEDSWDATKNTAVGSKSMFGNTSGYSNTAIGNRAIFSNTRGWNNVAIGDQALYSNIEGNHNTAIGNFSLFNNTSSYNTSIGFNSLYKNTTGLRNTATGYFALYNNTTGFYNTAIGNNALLNNTTGNSNVAIGNRALFSNTTRSSLIALGDSALFNNGTGANVSYQATNNIAIGSKALYSNTTGYENTAIGYNALSSNSIGYNNVASGIYALYNNMTGRYNTAIGDRPLYSNTTGSYNTADGYRTLYSNTIGNFNTANGINALYSNIKGYNNTASGYNALYWNTSGYNNVAYGAYAGNDNDSNTNCSFIGCLTGAVGMKNLTNATAIGYNASVDASNKVVIGNTSISSIGGYKGWTTYPSDGRFKKNVQQNVPGLAFINKLKPVTYNVDMEALDNTMHPEKRNNDSLENTAEQKKQKVENSKIIYSGFIVQDVEKVAKDLNYDFDAIDKTGKVWGLRYAEFVVPLVKAVQELSKANDDLVKKDEQQQNKIDQLETIVLSLQQKFEHCNPCITVVSSSQSQKVILNTGAFLEQNIPNPFNHTTAINYSLPQQFSIAKIVIIDKSGKILKEVNISGTGKGSLQVDAGTLASGAYNYSLYVSGKLIDTKQMVLAK